MKELKEKVAALEIDLETARKELVKAEEGFEERDLDKDIEDRRFACVTFLDNLMQVCLQKQWMKCVFE